MASRIIRTITPTDGAATTDTAQTAAPAQPTSSDTAIVGIASATTTPAPVTTAPPAASVPATTSIPSAAPVAASTTPVAPAQATFLYPSGNPSFNYIDVVQFDYSSTWISSNLTVFCTVNPASTVLTAYEIDLIKPGDTYLLKPILGNLPIQQFPAACHMMLMNAQDGSKVVNGAQFNIISTQGVASTYARTMTAAAAIANTQSVKTPTLLPASTTSLDSGTITYADASSTSGQGSSQTKDSSGLTATSTTTAGAAGSITESSSSSSGLSAGAKAGIAIGVIALVLAIVLAILLFIRRRRMQADKGERLASGHGSPTPAPIKSRKVVSKPSVSSVPKVVQMGTASSAEWQNFFGNRSIQKEMGEKGSAIA